MTAKEKCRVKYALAVYRHEMGFRGPVGHGSGFDWIDGHDKAEIEEIVADRIARDSSTGCRSRPGWRRLRPSTRRITTEIRVGPRRQG